MKKKDKRKAIAKHIIDRTLFIAKCVSKGDITKIIETEEQYLMQLYHLKAMPTYTNFEKGGIVPNE
jgi:hypothetical protein